MHNEELLTKYCLGDETRTSGTQRGEHKCIYGFRRRNLRETDYLEDLGTDGRIIQCRW